MLLKQIRPPEPPKRKKKKKKPQTPAQPVTPTRKTSQTQALPVTRKTSQTQALPVTRKTSQTQALPVTRKTSQTQALPVTRKTSQTQALPVARKTSLTQALPVTRKTSLTQALPVTLKTSLTQALPVTRKTSLTQALPVTRTDSKTQALPFGRTDSKTQALPITRTDSKTQTLPVTRIDSKTHALEASRPRSRSRSRSHSRSRLLTVKSKLKRRALHTVVTVIVAPVCVISIIIGAVCYCLVAFLETVPDMIVEWLQGNTPSNITKADKLADDIENFSSTVLETFISYIQFFLTVGIIFFALGDGGIIALFWKKTVYRSLYAAVLFVIMGLMIFTATQKTQVIEDTRLALKKSLLDYDGFMGNHTVSKIWDLIHVKLKCCGVDGYQDFHGLKNWPPENAKTLKTPLSCCKDIDVMNMTCALEGSANRQNNRLNYGCIAHVEEAARLLFKLPIFFIPPLIIMCSGIVLLVFFDARAVHQRKIFSHSSRSETS